MPSRATAASSPPKSNTTAVRRGELVAEHEGARWNLVPTAPTVRCRLRRLRGRSEHHDGRGAGLGEWANNEVGTIMPIAELGRHRRRFDVPCHSEAVQAVGQFLLGFAASQL